MFELFLSFCEVKTFLYFIKKQKKGTPVALATGVPMGTLDAIICRIRPASRGDRTSPLRLAQQFPERAEELFAKAEANAKAKYDRLVKLGEFYK